MRVFVIGNIGIDETIAIDTMPLAGSSILGTMQSRDIGGKGFNQAVVLARCGIETHLITVIGDDYRSIMIKDAIKVEPLQVDFFEKANSSCDFSFVLSMENGENVNITTNSMAQSLNFENLQDIFQTIQAGDYIVLQGNLRDDVTYEILQAACNIGAYSVFNPSPLRKCYKDWWHLVDIVFLNEGELFALTNKQGLEGAKLLRQAGVKSVILTLGAKGAMVITKKEEVFCKAHSVEAVDTTGAGDSFLAVALASALLREKEIDKIALHHANLAASLTVGRLGTFKAFPNKEELMAIFKGA